MKETFGMHEFLARPMTEAEIAAFFFGTAALFAFLIWWDPMKGVRQWLWGTASKAVCASLLVFVLLRWTPQDAFTLRDLLNGGVAVFGRTGSGKTSSSGYQLGKGIVSVPHSGGLILASSEEDRAFWQRIFAL